MNAYIYDADIYCEDCVKSIREQITSEGKSPESPDDQRSYDSDEFPKGPFADGGGEADCPNHCGQCHVFLENPITSDGERYVRETHRDRPSETTREWMSYYGLKPLRPVKLDEFTRAYVECALWSSTDGDDNKSLGAGDGPNEREDMSHGLTVEDIADDTLAEMAGDCADFQESFAVLLLQAGDDPQNGHDFWLTRNGHGAGFWDRGYPERIGRALTDMSKPYGSFDLYIGDDGKVYA